MSTGGRGQFSVVGGISLDTSAAERALQRFRENVQRQLNRPQQVVTPSTGQFGATPGILPSSVFGGAFAQDLKSAASTLQGAGEAWKEGIERATFFPQRPLTPTGAILAPQPPEQFLSPGAIQQGILGGGQQTLTTATFAKNLTRSSLSVADFSQAITKTTQELEKLNSTRFGTETQRAMRTGGTNVGGIRRQTVPLWQTVSGFTPEGFFGTRVDPWEGEFGLAPPGTTTAQIRGAANRRARQFNMLGTFARPGGGPGVPPDMPLPARGMTQQFGFAMREAFREITGGFRRGRDEQGFGLTRTAEVSLALSSILRPIAPGASNMLMSAGFASFSGFLGPLPAILTAATSALAAVTAATVAWTRTILNLAKTLEQAGFVTRGWKEANDALSQEMKVVIVDLGQAAQESFAPVIEDIATFIRDLDREVVRDLIRETGNLFEIFSTTANVLLPYVNMQLKAFNFLLGSISEIRFLRALAQFMDESEELTRKFSENFKAAFIGIEDLGFRIQESVASVDKEELQYLRAIARNTEEMKNKMPEGSPATGSEDDPTLLQGRPIPGLL